MIISYNNYYAFGMDMPGRSYNPTDYRYDFNGKPTDEELGDWQDYGERMYMKRLGRFPTPDPLTMVYPWYSPYQFAGNKPIWAIDQDGLEEFFRTDYYNAVGNLYKTEIKMVTNLGASQGVQTVHHSRVRETIDAAGNSSFNVSFSGSRMGTTQGVNAFATINPLVGDNGALSNHIRRVSLNLNAAGTPQRYQLPSGINVTTLDRATGNITTSTAVSGQLVPNTVGKLGNVGFVEQLFDGGGNYIGISQRNPRNPRSGFKIFGPTQSTFNAGNTNATISGAFAGDIPNSPFSQNAVPRFNDGVSRTLGSNFGLFGPAKGVIFTPRPRGPKKVAKF